MSGYKQDSVVSVHIHELWETVIVKSCEAGSLRKGTNEKGSQLKTEHMMQVMDQIGEIRKPYMTASTSRDDECCASKKMGRLCFGFNAKREIQDTSTNRKRSRKEKKTLSWQCTCKCRKWKSNTSKQQIVCQHGPNVAGIKRMWKVRSGCGTSRSAGKNTRAQAVLSSCSCRVWI